MFADFQEMKDLWLNSSLSPSAFLLNFLFFLHSSVLSLSYLLISGSLSSSTSLLLVSTFHYSSSLHSICPLHWSLRCFRGAWSWHSLSLLTQSLAHATCLLLQPVSVILSRSVNTFTLGLCYVTGKTKVGVGGATWKCIPEAKMFESTLTSKKQHYHENAFPGDRSMHVLARLC